MHKGMTSHLYRFRSVKSLLGEHAELERQEIYFAAPSELNDPMEGCKDIFWQGDKIVWRNLLRHYLLCLNHASSFFAVLGEEHPLKWETIPICDPYGAFDTDAMRNHQDMLLESFFSNKLVNTYVERLASRKQPIRQNELGVHIQSIHALAISTIHEVQHRRGLTLKSSNSPEFIKSIDSMLANAIKAVDAINQLEASHPDKEFAIEEVFSSQRKISGQLNLINHYNQTIDASQKNRLFVFVDFPEAYVREIERLTYPDWYAACFTKNYHNSSTWSHYGDNHKGVCLKFKTNCANDRRTINLHRIHGWSSTGPVHGPVAHEFYPIIYQSKHVSIDFFRSLGNLSIPIISREWFHDNKGRRSTCVDNGIDMTEEQRTTYWKMFADGATTKLNDWAYEEEYRLLLHGSLLDFSTHDCRLVQYDFADLDGIIFGIKTSTEDKLQIMKLIEKKCRLLGRNDFKFYQAYYSRQNARIENAEMSLLKFS